MFQLYYLILYLCYVLELGLLTFPNKDMRTTRLCLIYILYFIKPHSKHHLYFGSKNSISTLHPFPYNLFHLFFAWEEDRPHLHKQQQVAINTARSSSGFLYRGRTTIESLYCTTTNTHNYLGEAEQTTQRKLTRPSFSFRM